MRGQSRGKKGSFGRRFIAVLLAVVMSLVSVPQDIRAAESDVSIELEHKEYQSGECTITYSETNCWANYITADISITNNGDKKYENWKIDITNAGKIDNIWNADIITSEDGKYTIASKDYNSTIEPGQTVTFGIMAYGETGKPEIPDNIQLGKEPPHPGESGDNEYISGAETGVPECWKALNYALYTSDTTNLSIYTSKTNIRGSVHSNADINYQGTSLHVEGVVEAAGSIDLKTSNTADCCEVTSKLEKAEQIEMADITAELEAHARENGTIYSETTIFQGDSIAADTPLMIEGSAIFNATHFLGKGIIYAKESITYNVGDLATPDDSRIFVASEKGDITINGSDITMNAVLYAPDGCVRINANTFNINGRIIAKQVCINGTAVNITAGEQDYDMLGFMFEPELEITCEGNKKENRRITMSVSGSEEEKHLISENAVWKITRLSDTGTETEGEYYAADEDASDSLHKEMIFYEAGTYKIDVTLSNGTSEYTVTDEIIIAEDAEPKAAFKLSADYYARNEEGIAEITIADTSCSPDGDQIGQREWSIYYDADNNGIYTEDEKTDITAGNPDAETASGTDASGLPYINIDEDGLIYQTDKVGKYKAVLKVTETYSDTITKLLREKAYKNDDTTDTEEAACCFEVGNEAPEAKIDIEKSKSVDIVYTVGETDTDKANYYAAEMEKLKNELEAKGIDVRMETSESYELTAQDTFAWKEYDHKNYDGCENHITYEEDSIKMTGYTEDAYKDFLYIPDENPGLKTFEFDMQRDYTDWHSMEGGGFLFNTDVLEEENIIRGFCVTISHGNVYLSQIINADLQRFRNGSYEWIYHSGRVLKSIPIDNAYANHHFKIIAGAKKVSVWDGDTLLIDSFILPENDYGYGYGPIISHLSHDCGQRSYFTFKNITMRSVSGSSLSDIVDGYNWRPGAAHYVINFSDKELPELATEEETGGLAKALIENDAKFIAIGNENNEAQYTKLLNAAGTGGIYSPGDTPEETSANIKSYITGSILSEDYTIGEIITTDDIITYKGYYEDAENDEQYAAQWEYEYDPAVYEGQAGETEHIVKNTEEPITLFDNAGAYSIKLRVRDNPAGDNDSLDAYRKWSQTDEYDRLLLVNNRPIAEVSVTVAEDKTDPSLCMTGVTYTAHDSDHPSDSKKGIREEYYAYKNTKDGKWTEGRLPNKLTVGETYLVRYQVKDMEGTLSFPAVEVVRTSELLRYEEEKDTVPPEIHLKLSKTEAGIGDEIKIDGYASDDFGIQTYELYIDDKKITESFIRQIYTAGKPGIVTVRATATDMNGNNSTVEKTINIVNNRDMEAPAAEITSPNGEITDLNIKITGTADDETKFKKYTLGWRAGGEEEYTIFKESTEPVRNGVLGEIDFTECGMGSYEVLLTVWDESGNTSYTGFTVSVITEGGTGEPQTPEEPEVPEKELTIELSAEKTVPGEETAIHVTIPDESYTDSIKIWAGDVLISEGDTDAVYKPEEYGEIRIKAEAEADGGIIIAEAVLGVIDVTDVNKPVAEIKRPLDDTVLSEPVDFTGTAYDAEGMDYYRMEYRMINEDEYHEFASGREAVENGVLGTLDTTMLMNGEYVIRLFVQDKGGNTSETEKRYTVEGNLKIGAMNIGFTDITADIGGMNVSVNRMYDSRNKTSGDFGYGWSLGLLGMNIYECGDLSAGYKMIYSGSSFSSGYQMSEAENHDIVVTYGDGTSDRFEITFSPERQALVPIQETTLGYRCVTNPKVKLEVLCDTSAMVDGGELAFYDDGIYDTKSYKLTTGDGTDIYIRTDTGVYKIIDINGNIITVDQNGYHSDDGKSIALIRDGKGRVTSACDPSGNITKYEYDNCGDLISVTDSAMRMVKFTYDREHNLIEITDPMGIAVARNEYDDDGRLIAATDADGNRVEYDHDVDGRTEVVTDRRGNKTAYTYDDHGNIISTTDAYGNSTTSTYDAQGNQLTYTDELGNTTVYSYDSMGNITGVTDAAGTKLTAEYTQENLASGIKLGDKTLIASEYDSRGRLSSVEDAEGNSTGYSYNGDGKLTGLTDSIGEYRRITYDAAGNITSSANGAGESEAYTYDEKGRCTGVMVSREENGETVTYTSLYSYNEAGEIIQSVDNAGNTTHYEYDENGNRTAAVDPKGRRYTYEYDPKGNMTKACYPDGTFEEFTYDANDNNITATDRSGLTVTITYDKLNRPVEKQYADGTKETYTYDAAGNLTTVTDAAGAVTKYTYDSLNRNTAITDACGNTTTYKYDSLGRIEYRKDALGTYERYKYDNNGNVIETKCANGTTEWAEYDARNRLVVHADGNYNRTCYTYDGADRLTKVTDELGNSYAYEYDTNGNMISVTDACGHVTRYEYDAAGHMTGITNALGKSMEYTYDECGNLLTETDYAGTVTAYAYDEMNRIVKKTTGSDATEYYYNKAGLLTEVKRTEGSVTYTYDRYNRIEAKTDEHGITVRYGYDSAGRLATFDNGFGTTAYEYDLMGRLTGVTDKDGRKTTYEYNEVGNRTAVHYPDGITIKYTYDCYHRLTSERAEDASGKYICEYRNCMYGRAGERLAVAESDRSGRNMDIRYEYDDLNRLITEKITCKGNILTNRYTYDAVGNRTEKTTAVQGDISVFADPEQDGVKITEGTTTYTYNALNQLVTEETPQGTVQYTYDDNGNLISVGGAGSAEYSYDAEGHLIKAETRNEDGITVESYTYDYEGNRTSKTVDDGEAIYYTLDTSGGLTHVAAETDKSGNLLKSYARGDELISMETPDGIWYYILDGHGNVRMLADGAGNITDIYSYDAYGNLLERKGSTDNEYLYTGEQYNAGTGLYYLRARYMNPSTGTFTSMDKWQGNPYEPVTLNKYIYANSNPVMNKDPSGYSSIGELSTCMTASQILSNSLHFIRLSALKGMIAGGAFGAIDSMLGGNGWQQVWKDALKGMCIGAAIGCLISTLACYAVIYPICLTALHVFRWGFLVYGGVGVYISASEGNVAQAVFRGIMSLLAFAGTGKLIGDVKAVRGNGNGGKFYKKGGGSQREDFISEHSQKHAYNPNLKSTKNRTQYGENVDVSKLCEDTIMNPDEVFYDSEYNIIKYSKEYGFNISTPDTPTGSHRVFIVLDKISGRTNKNTQYPYYKGD